MPNFQNAGHGPRERSPDATGDARRARMGLLIRHIMTPGAKPVPCKTKRPFTMVVLVRPNARIRIEKGATPMSAERMVPLGIVFNRWPANISQVEIGHDDLSSDTTIRQGRGCFAVVGTGTDRSLLIPHRWMWDDLRRKYGGLSHGNL